MGSKRTRPPGDDGPPFDIGPPGWGPPPPGGWGPPPPGGWGPLPPEDWGPPPPGEWGPLPPEGWEPRGPPPPGGWGPFPPGGWGPPPPDGWGPGGPPPPDWRLRGPPPPGWGGYPDDWLPPEDWRPPHPDDWRPPHPDDWRPPHPDDWRPPHPDDWRLRPRGWSPPPGWGPDGPLEAWGPEPLPSGPLLPPLDPVAYGPPIPPPGIPPPGIPPPMGFPPGWTGEPASVDVMPNPPPDQPEWIKALISAPPTDVAPADSKKTEEPTVSVAADPPTVAPRPKTTPTANANKAIGLLGKRTFEKPPPGRSTGIISFIGPNFGYIEREDLEKYTFSFDAFFGNPKAMTPGVRVHFTACKDKNSLIATDVKVAPGGTENVDTDIYEAVVTQPITEPQPGERQYPGQVHVSIGPLRTSLSFERKDSTVTLLKNDQVLINLLTDIVTEKRRATNIRPKIPSTFSDTQEIREQGIIISLKDGKGIIKSSEHGELPFDVKENFSDVEFTTEDVNEEVEFTVITLRKGKCAIRIRRVKEPLLLTFCSATAAAKEDTMSQKAKGDTDNALKSQRRRNQELGANMMLDPELYEGIVTQTIIEPTDQLPGYPGQIHANIGPDHTNVTFDHRDCGVTLLKNDHVLINLLYDMSTGKRRAANIKPKIPFTFSYTKENRQLGVITSLSDDEGIVNATEHGDVPFDICENFSDTEFSSNDIQKEVEFTIAMVSSKKRAVRLMRTKKVEDPILGEQKKREEEEKKKKLEKEERKKRMEEELQREAEKKRKAEVAAALEAAKCKWTPLGFKMRDPNTLDEVSKERFEGTILKAISKTMKKIKLEPVEERGAPEVGQMALTQVKLKVEKTEGKDEEEGKGAGVDVKTEVKKEEKDHPADAAAERGAKLEPELGRLVMTVDGQQKQLMFGPDDLLSTATMLDGDKVRFNIATHRETKEERATYVEILPESFEESIEQRRHGIIIEFSEDSGLIKCTQNPQLYFHMSEVIEKKKLELNEKVEFSVVPHETAEGGNQAIRIIRFTESVFQSVRKLGGVAASKGKMTIKLNKASEDTAKIKPDTEKLKAVVKSLRAQDKTSITKRDHSSARRRYSRSRSQSRSRARSRSKSRSPPRDQFGRTMKKRRSTSVDRDRKGNRRRRSRSRERFRRSSKSRSRSSSRGSGKSRSRSRERSKDRAVKKRSKHSREREESHKRRREMSTPSRRFGAMEDELARKQQELDELNEMIAYKKSLVDRDPGQRTCIDYDHGRIAVPLAEFKPVRSILKNRPEGPEYLHRPPQPYGDAYYDRPYSPYKERLYGDRYSDPYVSHPYSDRPYANHPYSERVYENRPYVEEIYSGAPSASQHYTDRYDVYDEPCDDRYYDPQYDPYRSVEHRSPHSSLSPPPSLSGKLPASSTNSPPTHTALASPPPYRPPSPTDPPPRSPSPKLKSATPCQSTPANKPPLDRFLDMLNKKVDAQKKSEPVYATDDLLPHERALRDGKGFSRIVGMAQGLPSSSLRIEEENNQQSSKQSLEERTSEESKSKPEPYEKIQSLLRTIGLKLSTGDVSKLASRAQEKIYSSNLSSTEKERLSSPMEQQQVSRTGSVESDHIHSPSPARSSSLEPLSKHKSISEYEEFLDREESESLKKAQRLQSIIKTTSSTAPSVKPPPGPPPAHCQHPPPPVDFPIGIITQTPQSQSSTAIRMGTAEPSVISQPPQIFRSAAGLPSGPPPRHPGQCPPGPPPGPPPRRLSGQTPPGPPPGPPPRRPTGQPPITSPSAQEVLPFIGQQCEAPPPMSGSPLLCKTTAVAIPSPASSTAAKSNLSSDEKSAISTTVARCLKVIETVKNLAVQPPTKPGKSVQFSLPTELSTSSVQSSAGTEEEIRTKQKEKLDLYNQRLLEKREQQYQEMLACKKGEKNKDPPGKPVSSEPKNVWICGHSLVYWAESRAKSPEVGMQLGMDPNKVTVWWKGIQGMTWPQLLPQLHQLKVTWPNPDVLIIHLGGNDLSTDSPTDLLASVKKDLTSMRSIFPQCILVWSNILPRRVWRHSSDSHEVDLVRSTVNRRIQNIISDLGGTSLTHENIRCGTNTGLYRADGIHLSSKGIDLFNLNLQDFLEKWEMSLEKC